MVAMSAVVVMPLEVYAYHSVMDTGNIIERGTFKAQVENQIVSSPENRLNINARLDMGLNEEAEFRGVIGIGATDLHVGVFYKWIPIPDFSQQPAVGLLSGLTYASSTKDNSLTLHFNPIVSKTFEMELGEITPYASLPIGLRSTSRYNSSTKLDIPVHLTLGGELRTTPWDKVRFMAEISFNIQNTFNYFNLGANISFDEEGMLLR